MPNATIKAVAKDAGVSIATVSRVVNKNAYVSPDLAQRVMRSIDKLHYYPNSIARSLKFESTLSIGLIVSDIANSFFCVISRSVEDAVRGHGYNLIVCSTDGSPEKERAQIELLLSKKVDGIVINITGFNDPFIASVSRSVPIVLCGRRIDHPAFVGDFVDSDNVDGAYQLTRHLIERGHRRIGFINGEPQVSSAQERARGFREAMAELGCSESDIAPYCFNGNFNDSQTGARGTSELLALPEPPTAILAMNNELCIGVLRYCRTHGVEVPQTVSIACYGRPHNSDLLYVEPSFVTMEPSTIGRRIGELLIQRIEQKNQIANREIRYAPQLVACGGVRAC